ncbi:endo alpha-1,4 polygalactosaminidase [Yinghuangia sp. ASG 101]|uniref:endo alpha-1,4 polygalactosaminidase n=1 Tax=Yinghuangia sp. ASG 101 TaxID=2896848 RepID=UPI001E2AD0ED|nr:endo alpha-1,4 polygalactosaminidase [Yinghuangia sp. ASG 101]UGQ12919.1 endo alpha-1,4 polygalactosaminidase [Yinghuangia sp. ASG 101]
MALWGAALALAFSTACGAASNGARADANGSGESAPAATAPTDLRDPGSGTGPPTPPVRVDPSAPDSGPADAVPPAAGTGGEPAAPPPPAPATPRAEAAGAGPPDADAGFDYQIGGAYPPPAGVTVVARDREAKPSAGAYNVCYVNAFQTQPDATRWWQTTHPDLLLRDGDAVVMDEDWGEALLDVSTEAKRNALIGVVGPWIDACARDGFQAVEPDNLDSFGRSHGRLTLAQNAAFARLLAARAHAAGLAIAQKNTVEMVDRRADIGFDFVVSESCGAYDECGAFAAAYADRVFVVEYTRAEFDATCRAWGDRLLVVLRDRDVTAPGSRGYVYASC